MSIALLADICVTVGHGTLARIIAVGVPWLLLAAANAAGIVWHRRRGAHQRRGAETAARAEAMTAAASDRLERIP
ncbi:MAG: hypothetical protein M0Z95_20935 [Actinomycetota bacterium]|jgi:hypothetical protein|nr:hypothetical protein [Actinomycetota bacterium]